MPRRHILTERQRQLLFDLPVDEETLLRYYTLDDEDILHIQKRRNAHNKLGFALQLCAFRYPGRLLTAGEVIPIPVTEFIAAQIGVKPLDISGYAETDVTRRRHLIDLRSIYGYKMFSGRIANDIKSWLAGEAEKSRTNEDLVKRFIRECRHAQTILPRMSTIERLCADSLISAERRIESRIVSRLSDTIKVQLDALLTESGGGGISIFIWLRQFEVGKNSADINRLLDRLECLQGIELLVDVLDSIPPYQITRLRRQGERYFTDGLLDISSDRRLAVLAVCALEWRYSIADAVVETHDRIVGKIWRDAKKLCDAQIGDAKTSLQDTLRSFKCLGAALLEAKGDGALLDPAIARACGWQSLEGLVATAAKLSNTMSADPLNHVGQGYHRFRRYTPRMLRALDIKAASVADPLMKAVHIIKENKEVVEKPTDFLRRNSKWYQHLKSHDTDAHRLWEVAVMSHLRDAFRSGDIWLSHSRRYGDLKQALVSLDAARTTPRLSVPFNPEEWLNDRKKRMSDGLKRLDIATKSGSIQGCSIENGILKIERLKTAVPAEAEEIVLDLYKRMPDVRITDMLLDVDKAIGFTDAFTHLRTGAPCKDKIGLLNVLLAEGLNLGLSKMAEATNTHDYFQLSRLSRWHIESDAINRSLAMVIDAQSALPMAQFWGNGGTASSDGQFFPATRQGEAMNLVNAKYGNEPGLKSYTHVSDQFAPFATQNIPATVNEAPYILDGLLMNEVGKKIREQYTDTGGFTDHVFAVTSLISYRFIPRIRDLPSKRLYIFDPTTVPKGLKGLVGGKVREDTISANWPGILRSAATMVAGIMPPSQLLRKFASHPRQHDLAIALREVGRIERTLFIIDWLLDTDMQRRAQIGLNKGESHHALKNALRIGRQGEIRDRTTEGQHYRMAGLNLLAAIIIYWNTVHLGKSVIKRKIAGLDCSPKLLAHTSPLGWAHILITGEYKWPKE